MTKNRINPSRILAQKIIISLSTGLGATAILLLPLIFAGCSGGPRYFLADASLFKEGAKLAILPLVNFSRRQQAPDLLMNSLVIEILGTRKFKVADPGAVETMILEKRIRLTDRLPLETAKELAVSLNADYFLIGTINEFKFIQASSESFPVISLNLRVISPLNGEILWASTHTRRGDDSETVFGLGKVKTLERMSEIIIHDMVKTLKH